MRKVAFVINSLGQGGAERVLVNLLSAMGEERRSRLEVSVILLDRESEFRQLPAWVSKHVLDSRGSLIRSVLGLRRHLGQHAPDLVVSFLVRANVASALVCRLLHVRCIVCERMHLSSHLEGRYRGLRLLAAKAFPKLAYRLADRSVGVSSGVTEDMETRFGADPRRTMTIVNPFNLDAIRRDAAAAPEFELPARFIVAVGRLEPSKAMHVLIDAYLASGIEPHLVILGDGSCRATLQEQIAANGASDRIHMPGYAANPFAVTTRAEAYVSASTNEGFPNAMVEAMAVGLPIVATDCRSGPAEILADSPRRLNSGRIEFCQFGVLVPENDTALLGEAIRAIISDPDRAACYSQRSRTRAKDFAADVIAERMWGLIEAELRVAAPDTSANDPARCRPN